MLGVPDRGGETGAGEGGAGGPGEEDGGVAGFVAGVLVPGAVCWFVRDGFSRMGRGFLASWLAHSGGATVWVVRE